MAKQKQTPTKAQPITSHALFPAVVGLWFGALFGFGSLAVRPSLIEDMVLSTRIDLIVPAAAPPLGLTARILLALVMAALGTIVGVVLGRRLNRPKPELKERARTARGAAPAAQSPQRARDAHPDAPSCTPISMQELESGDDLGGLTLADGRLAGRRRALTVDHGPDEFVPHELAPLPGGAPQMLDMAELPAIPAVLAAAASPVVAEMTITLPAAGPDRQVFQPVPAAQPALAPESAAAHADGRQVFGMEPASLQPEQPRQIFGLAASDDHLPPDFVREAGYKTSVFETEVTKPLFDRGPAEQALAAPQSAPVPPLVEAAAGAARDPLPSPSSLGMTDLAARLAESMQRRRAARNAALAVPIVAEPLATAAEPVAPAPIQFAAPDEALAMAPEVPAIASEPAPPAAQPSFAAPVQAEQSPVPAAEPHGDDALPSSLRPLALDAFLEEDLQFGASLLPPRRLAAEAPVAPAQPAAIPQPDSAPVADAAEPSEEPIAEENYASLLGIGGGRAGFVRIEEPEADAAAPEPVVIFPGQAPLGQAPQFTPTAPVALSEDGASLRRFDSPAAAEQGQSVDLGTAGALVPPDEAAQALRTALASLQRISGAA